MGNNMNIVLDTNVLVSAIWSPGRNASDILNAVFAGKFTACYDYRILEEYDRVLHYRKFPFTEWEIHSLLDPLVKNGFSVIAEPVADIPFTDESDRKFYEVAKFCQAVLITGNRKHFPKDPYIMTIAEFRQQYLQRSL